MSAAEPATSTIGPTQSLVAVDPWRSARMLHATLLALSLVTVLLAAVLEIQGEMHVALSGWTLPETCVWRKFMAMNCPGCGMTRAFICLARGDFAGAWHFNPTALPLFAVVALQIPYRGWQLWRISRGQGEWISRWQVIVPVALGVVLLLRWVWWLAGSLF
jgi:hypothetical protein